MTQSWIHTNQTTISCPAAREMRFSGSLSERAGLCGIVNFENSNYQPKPQGGSLDRLDFGRKI
ncbi:MAG: hypothetical protein M3384_15925 [Acidobacteriota bacterium]|nr:hypothetical protein [Acidobacteriota bacterium]